MIRCIEKMEAGSSHTEFKDVKTYAPDLGVPLSEFFVELAYGWVPCGARTVRHPGTGEIISLIQAFERGFARRV